MNKRKLIISSLVVFVFGLIMSQNLSYSQSKKKQIESLNFKIDSLSQVIFKERNAQKNTLSSLEIKESKSKQKVDSLNNDIKKNENQVVSKIKEKQKNRQEILRLSNEIDVKKDSLEALIISQIVKWDIDTLNVTSKKSRCFDASNQLFLFIKSGPVEDRIIKTINDGIEKLKCKIPEILDGNGIEYSEFFDDCTDWLKNLCDRPWSVWNDMRYFKTKKYFSVLQRSHLSYCAANWGYLGYSSKNYNLNSGEEIIIIENEQSKQIIKAEIKNYFEKLKTTDPNFENQMDFIKTIEYDEIMEKIMKFPISKLTFYFNDDDLLSLIYYYEFDRYNDRTLIIPLPKLQKSLSL